MAERRRWEHEARDWRRQWEQTQEQLESLRAALQDFNEKQEMWVSVERDYRRELEEARAALGEAEAQRDEARREREEMRGSRDEVLRKRGQWELELSIARRDAGRAEALEAALEDLLGAVQPTKYNEPHREHARRALAGEPRTASSG